MPTSIARVAKVCLLCGALHNRHTSASYLIACGQDVVSVSKRLGHAKPSTTLTIYAHAFKKKDLVSAKYMEGLYPKTEDKENKNNKAN